MLHGFLDRFRRGGAAPSHEVQEALAELARLAAGRPAFREPAELLAAVLPLLFEPPSPPPQVTLTSEAGMARLAAGVPLLRDERLPLDAGVLRERWLRLCAALGSDRARAAADAVRQGRLEPAVLAGRVLGGQPTAGLQEADALGLDAGLAATVLRWTLFPLLAPLALALAPLHASARWERGYCPVCGSWPLLGELRGLEQVRFLRCGLCTTGWPLDRLVCPYCGNRDHRQLGYLHVEGEEAQYRAAHCDACRGYVKLVATLAALPGPQLLVADLATMHLDLAAAEQAYVSG